jgi:hypothetical protein
VITTLKQLYKYALLLVLINILLPGTGFLLNSFLGVNLYLKDIIALSIFFTIISVITIGIFLRGNNREPDSQAMHTLVAVSLKFLLDMILALVWFFVFKKASFTSGLIFFVLYLTLTLFSIFVILKILKYRALLNLH